MMQFLISSCCMTLSLMFMQMKHPLAMGLLLLIQTFFICLMTGTYTKTFWFSYILFLIFLGGMLVLFIYVTSLASNEMFSMSMKSLILAFSSIYLILFLLLILDNMMMTMFMKNNEMNPLYFMKTFINENTLSLNKMYNFPTNLVTLLLINYLFLTLIAVVKITKNFFGPLRQMN